MKKNFIQLTGMTTKFKPTKFPAKDLEIRDFRTWCTDNGIDINSKVYIGHEESCHGIGVIATREIRQGDVVAIIHRSALLTASRSVAGAVMRNDKQFMSQIARGINPWIPLLIALTTEYAQSGHSKWQPYLNLVPNNETCPPPMLWDEEERTQLLRGTGVDGLVERDLRRISSDYATIVEPFFKRNRELIPDKYSQTIYEKAVSFVMSYSFTDSKGDDPLSNTVMVPFVDLLNHHHNHNAELSYHPTHLRLVAIRDIKKGEEIMNTFGQLPNYSLLHTYGFAIPGNLCDAACLPLKLIEEVCLSADTGSTARKWAVLKRKGLLEESYEVSNSGQPDEELLKLIRHIDIISLEANTLALLPPLKLYRKWSVKLDTLKPEEKEMLKRIILAGIKSLPHPLTPEMQLSNSSKCRQQVSWTVRESTQKCLQTCLTFFS